METWRGMETALTDKQIWVPAVEYFTFHNLFIHLEGVGLLWVTVVEAIQQLYMTFELMFWWVDFEDKNKIKSLWIPLFQSFQMICKP